MNVVDLPQPCTHGVYEDAVARYATLVKGRAVGIHQVGNVPYPGLSDIRLIVVTDHVGVDNRFFFSAFQRLPERYHRLFLHEPFILPGWSVRVLRHTAHYRLKLIAGRDVLQPFAPSDEHDERWCRMLESYCAYAAFGAKTRRLQQLKGREAIALAGGLRRVLADAATIVPEAANETYVNEIEELRRTFFENDADPVERVRTAWISFENAFSRFDSVMQARLRATSTDDAVAVARARLRGEEECADFDRDYAFRRTRAIAGYQQELASLGFPFGHLFSVAAHPLCARTAGAAPLLETLLRSVYRVRRRLTEHAAVRA